MIIGDPLLPATMHATNTPAKGEEDEGKDKEANNHGRNDAEIHHLRDCVGYDTT